MSDANGAVPKRLGTRKVRAETTAVVEMEVLVVACCKCGKIAPDPSPESAGQQLRWTRFNSGSIWPDVNGWWRCEPMLVASLDCPAPFLCPACAPEEVKAAIHG